MLQWVVAVAQTPAHLCQVLSCLHTRSDKRGVHVQVVHCDLKAKNILLNKDRTMAKIGDVGLARIMAETHLSTASGFFGTFAYTAPEVLGRRRCDEKVLRAPCTLQQMLTGAF